MSSSKPRHFTHIGHAAADTDVVAQLLDDVDDWPRWARLLALQARWERWGDPIPGGRGAVRKLGAWPVWIREQITERKPGEQRYTVLTPSFFRSYVGVVLWEAAPSGGTNIEWSVQFSAHSRLAAPVLQATLRFVIGGLLERLINVAENTKSDMRIP